MKFSEYFDLEGLTQSDLDFLDGLVYKDVPLYIDPSQIEVQEGEWFEESARVINSFFDTVFTLYREGENAKAESLLKNAHEPNETKLGVSQGNPQGRGTSPEKLVEVFRHVIDQGLLRDELVNQYNDLTIFVKDFAEDRMSDLVTNLIREQLAEYTIQQSEIYGFELTEHPVNIGVSWDVETLNWKEVHQRALYANEELLLLIPKSIVVVNYLFNVEEYLSKTIYDWRKKHHLENDTPLVRKKFVKKHDKEISYPPSNDVLIEKEITEMGLSRKEYAINMSLEKGDLIDGFRRLIDHTLRGTNSNRLSDEELTRIVDKRNNE
ncbi:hypothetical protein D0439_10095 [Lysinibacillus fusiformis]|uniref:hypothetical protein n=1 Tax=Lysinibacillus fusiformis TaxID=28031 RepID=UPI0011BB90C5|nr:hypothetical protein [Lysinibacillus fusiformis]QDZ98961.1 hypothetical protein D0439_10095 [Lysinibacillus fusiformis]